MDSHLEVNRRHWDEVTDIHSRNNVYGIDDFKGGNCRLHRVELEELGEVSGKTLLHLQCHFGLDTLSWARRGAIVTGVDFSPKAIKLARSLAKDVGIDARFIESDVHALQSQLTEQFDIVFMSYGVLGWLPDLKAWSAIVARYLKPGGIFYIVEGHPFIKVFPIDSDITDGLKELRPWFSYFHDPAGTFWESNIDYADGTTKTPPELNWQHSIGDVVNALVGSGLQIDFLYEFPYCAWKIVAFAELVERFSASHGYYGLPARFPPLPLMFSITASRRPTYLGASHSHGDRYHSSARAMHSVKRISPMLAVEDMDATLRFYTDILQFESVMKSPTYSIIGQDGATIHLMKAANHNVLDAVRGHTDIYVEVSEINALWEHVCKFKEQYRIRDLFDRDYGMREFHISDPNGCLVFVGQKIG